MSRDAKDVASIRPRVSGLQDDCGTNPYNSHSSNGFAVIEQGDREKEFCSSSPTAYGSALWLRTASRTQIGDQVPNVARTKDGPRQMSFGQEGIHSGRMVPHGCGEVDGGVE
jgi:hypothetical protein